MWGTEQFDDWGATVVGALLDRDPSLHLDPQSDAIAWQGSGAMHLTGRADGPALMAPAHLVPGVRWLGEAAGIGDLDALALLGERAACAGFTRNGRTSCGGATRLLDAADGPIALSLARPTDVEMLPALLESDVGDDPWATLAVALPTHVAAHWVERGTLLGLAIAALGEAPAPTVATPAVRATAVRPTGVGGDATAKDLHAIRVLDLSSLWAGPLCTHVLQRHGATVTKVESPKRPDGARAGSPLFFDLLNAGKRSAALDLASPVGRAAVAELIAASDVVIEASRPRALEQVGISALDALRNGRTRVWVAITGHGQSPSGRDRVAFGDDAAVAGGLVGWDGDVPVFLADAVADPLTGLTAAAAVLAALRSDQRWYVDISMARVAAAFAGPAGVARFLRGDPALPRHRDPRGTGPELAST